MDRRSPDSDDCRWPGPWRFYAVRWGFPNVIAADDGRYITSSVPAECGPLLAAGPGLLAVLDKIAALTAPGSPAHDLAVGAVEFHAATLLQSVGTSIRPKGLESAEGRVSQRISINRGNDEDRVWVAGAAGGMGGAVWSSNGDDCGCRISGGTDY